MALYAIRRIIGAIPLLLIVSFISFGIVVSLPGDFMDLLASPTMSAEAIEARREALGLNKSLPVRYGMWIKEVLSGNLGSSVASGRSVNLLIAQRVGPTLTLMGTALLLSLIIALPLGMLSALRANSVFDRLASIIAFAGVSVPTFFSGLVLIYLFSVHFRLLPSGMMETPGSAFDLGDRLQHLVLPVAVLGFQGTAIYTRYIRSAMLDVIRQDYIRTAKAKGLSDRVVYYKHGLRNALISVATLLGLALPSLLSGAVITEQVFSWPGIGRLLVDSVNGRDYPVVLGITMMIALLVIIGNLLADLLYAVLDPRVKYS